MGERLDEGGGKSLTQLPNKYPSSFSHENARTVSEKSHGEKSRLIFCPQIDDFLLPGKTNTIFRRGGPRRACLDWLRPRW